MSDSTRHTSLAVAPLTPQGFAPFGDVISARPDGQQFHINQGFATRFHDLARIDVGQDADGRVLVNVFRALPRALPMQLQVMERHPLGSQAFVAMSELPFWWWWPRLRRSCSPGRSGVSWPRPGRA